MVKPGGAVAFRVSRAYEDEGQSNDTLRTGGEYTGDFEAAVLWDDNAVIDESALDVSGSGSNTVVYVETNNHVGNAVVKIVKKDDDVDKTPVWSYHIWVTDYEGEDPIQMANGHKFMDRNLGATTADLEPTAYGLLYQWGRKDPFAGGVANSAGYAARAKFSFSSGNKVTNTNANEAGIAAGIMESIQNPTIFYTAGIKGDWLPAHNNYLWNQQTNNKTIYDPCPSGWRVPAFIDNIADKAHSPWMEYDSDNYATMLATGGWVWRVTGYVFTHKNNTTTCYPAVGRRSRMHGQPEYEQTTGYNWSATSNQKDAYDFRTHIEGAGTQHYNEKAYGNSVRCVQEYPGP
jgi:hypothetical protein